MSMRARRNPDGARGRRPRGHSIWICTAIVISLVSILLGVNVSNLCNQALVPKEYEYNIDMPVLPAVTDRREETTRAGSAVEQFTIYGHAHLMKTAGTNINGALAARYDNVCGNKGNSFDMYQFNQRALLTPNITNTRLAGGIDTATHLNLRGNRGQPGKEAMEEIGFETCDYISYECSWFTWPRIVNDLRAAAPPNLNITLELHVPCRDPVDHMLSLCNHKGREFTCVEDDDRKLMEEIVGCLYRKSRYSILGGELDEMKERQPDHPRLQGPYGSKQSIRFSDVVRKRVRSANRRPQFSRRLVDDEESPNVRVRCFRPIPIDPYVEYMGKFLRRRRLEARPYFKRTSNAPRKNTRECLRTTHANRPDYLQKVRDMLIEKDETFRYCDECMGSEHELPLQ